MTGLAAHAVSVSAGAIRFADTFNTAVPFIDRHVAEGRGAKIAIRTLDGETVTYAALAERVNRAGNLLRHGLGAAPGQRAMLIVKDCPAFFYAFWGAIKAGLVPVPLNTLLRAKDYEYMIADSGAAIVLYSPEFAAEVEPALAALEKKPAALRVDGPGETFLARLAAAAPALAPHPAGPLDDCFWLYSSGSTGRPKGAVHRQRDMVTTSQRYGVETLGIRESDTMYSAAKLFFAYGLGNAMTFPLWVGATAVLAAPRPTPELTFDIIARFRPTLFFGVPTLYAAQLAALDGGARPDLSSLRHCASAGEALPAHLFKRWKERTGLTILDGWGSTEALHIVISNTAGDAAPGRSGLPVPGYEARIVDEAGKPVARGQSGTLHVRGDSTARLYWNQPERTEAAMLPGGWLNSGDTYVQDEAGYYVYAGRSDDMMKVGGIWTSPIEIEGRLLEHPAVLEAAVVGRADADALVKPEAWIVLKAPAADTGALEADLREHCKKGLAPYKYPRWFRFVPELPKTATGKIQRFKLRG
jgi:benzoate-CoA ligase family protein